MALERRYALAGDFEAMAARDQEAAETGHTRNAPEDPDAERLTISQSRLAPFIRAGGHGWTNDHAPLTHVHNRNCARAAEFRGARGRSGVE
jgi:hypothetical protein